MGLSEKPGIKNMGKTTESLLITLVFFGGSLQALNNENIVASSSFAVEITGTSRSLAPMIDSLYPIPPSIQRKRNFVLPTKQKFPLSLTHPRYTQKTRAYELNKKNAWLENAWLEKELNTLHQSQQLNESIINEIEPLPEIKMLPPKEPLLPLEASDPAPENLIINEPITPTAPILKANSISDLTLHIKNTETTHIVNAQLLLDEITFIKSIASRDGHYKILNLSADLLNAYAPNLAALSLKNCILGQSISYTLTNISDNKGTTITTNNSTNPDKIISLPGTLAIAAINLHSLEKFINGISFIDGSVTPPDTSSLPPSTKIPVTIPASNLRYPFLGTPQKFSQNGYPLFNFTANYFPLNQAYQRRNKLYSPALNDPTVIAMFKDLVLIGFKHHEALQLLTVTKNGGIIGNFGGKIPSINRADISALINKKIRRLGLNHKSNMLVSELVDGINSLRKIKSKSSLNHFSRLLTHKKK